MLQLFGFLKQHRNGLAVVFLVLVATVLLISVRSGKGGAMAVREVAMDAAAPLHQLLLSPIDAVRAFGSKITELSRLELENRSLRAEVASLRPMRLQNQELVAENKRLRHLLNMRPDPEYTSVTARMTAISSSAFARAFMIGAGRRAGITEQSPVVSADGLAGRVVRVSERAAMVLSLLDPNSRVPVKIQRPGVDIWYPGVAAGTNGPFLHVEYVAKDAGVKLGDEVVTSGAGGVFPKGLLLGRVSGTTPHEVGLFQRIVVTPATDFARLEEVRILLRVDADPNESQGSLLDELPDAPPAEGHGPPSSEPAQPPAGPG
ncbi:MAG: rod shape-determining protein MreC [Magnetococcus sp. WYHC-3]